MRNITNMAEAYKNIREKLKPSDGAGAYIKDFRKSDAPQFKGKSDKKIQKMAIAAYLDDKEKNENFDIKVARTTLDEKKAVITIDVKKPQVNKHITDIMKKVGSKVKATKKSNGYVMSGDVKDLTTVVDYLFDKNLSNIVNPKDMPMDIKMLKNSKDMDMDPAKHVAKSKRNPDKFCVFDKDGNEVKLFDKKEDAIAYAKANHDKLMGEKLDDKDTGIVKAVVAKLKKASGAHAGQAKDLQKALDEGPVIVGEGINPYVSMYRDKKGKMVYDVLDKNEKSAFKTSNMKVAQDYLNKNYNKLKEENINEAKFAVKLMGIPGAIYIDAESAGKVKQKIRKMLRKPDDLISVDRVLPTDFKADLRQRIKGVPSDDTEMAQKEELEEKFKPEGGELFVVTAGPGDNAQKVIGMDKNLRKAQKIRDDYNRKNRPSKPSHKARVYAQTKASQPRNKFKIGQDISYSEYGNKLQFTKIKEMAKGFDEPEFSKKNMVLNKIGLVAQKKKELGKHTDESKKSPLGVHMGEGRRSKYDMDQDDEEGANKNIIMQLRKSVDLKGRFDVEFEDGKKVKVKDTIARAAVLKHAGMRRPAEKLAFQKKIEKSYRDLLNALKGR